MGEEEAGPGCGVTGTRSLPLGPASPSKQQGRGAHRRGVRRVKGAHLVTHGAGRKVEPSRPAATHPPHRGVFLPQAPSPGHQLVQAGPEPGHLAPEPRQIPRSALRRRNQGGRGSDRRKSGERGRGAGVRERPPGRGNHRLWPHLGPSPGEDRAGAPVPSFLQPVLAAHLLCAGSRAGCRGHSGGHGEAPRPGGSHAPADEQDWPVINPITGHFITGRSCAV